MSAALDGIRVLDLSRGIAGPLATMLLADFGADVVKVEPPSGDPARALPGFAVWNRNKRSIVLDVSSVEGRSRLAEWLAGADVCVLSSAEPELEPEALAARYPRLVVLYAPPYTPGTTPWAGGEESHPLLSAMAGPARRQSSFNGGPIDLVYPFPLYVQGHWAAGCLVAALLERERSGRGQVVTVSGVHGVMVSACGTMIVVPGQTPLPTNVGPGGRHPCYTTYQCQDDQWLFLAALTPKFQVNAFKVLGVGDVFADERIGGVPSRILLPENRGWVRQLLGDAFRTRPRDEWLRALEVGDCPAGALGNRDEWLDHPQLIANGLRVEVDDPERGHVVMPGVPLVMTETPGGVRAPAPMLGDSDGVQPWGIGRESLTVDEPLLKEKQNLGRESLTVDELRLEEKQNLADETPSPDDGMSTSRPFGLGSRATSVEHSLAEEATVRGPLAGVRVLDLGTILAGPYAGALLAELGADVVKVEAPVGDPFRETGFIYNRGQRGLAIDLSKPDARQAFFQLVRTSDVVLDNARLGVLERLHIDYASLEQVKPDIVTFSVNGFGLAGPLATKPGFDPVLQAMSGMMTAQGGECDPVLFTIPINDITAATVAVLGICLGLLHRERSGVGQRVWTSLLGCSAQMQAGELVRVAGRGPAVWGGCDFAGSGPLDRFYALKDGWLRIQAPNAEALQAAGVLDPAVPLATDDELAAALGQRLESTSVSDALACLSAAGVPAVPARTPGDLPQDPRLRDLDMFTTFHMQDGTPFYVTNRYARFSRTQQQAVLTPPGTGEHSRALLVDAGVSEDSVDALIAAGAVKQGEPFRVVAIQNYR